MENRRNYYRILHVQPDAPVEVIRASFRTLMQRLKMHPDLGGDHWNAALINEAYSVLTDTAKRASYDRNRGTRVRRSRVRETTQASPAECAANPRPRIANSCPFCHTRAPRGAAFMPDTECRECGSPLRLAQKSWLEHDGSRTVNRIQRQHAVAFNTAWPQEERYAGTTRDISLTGMQIETVHGLTPGQLLKLDCTLCSAVARVVNQRQRRSGFRVVTSVGVEFITLRLAATQGAFVSTMA